MTTGLVYLKEEFGVTPKVGWQIDPFGYNSFMPSIFTQFGYDYLVLNRIGDEWKDEFKEKGTMEFYLKTMNHNGETD